MVVEDAGPGDGVGVAEGGEVGEGGEERQEVGHVFGDGALAFVVADFEVADAGEAAGHFPEEDVVDVDEVEGVQRGPVHGGEPAVEVGAGDIDGLGGGEVVGCGFFEDEGLHGSGVVQGWGGLVAEGTVFAEVVAVEGHILEWRKAIAGEEIEIH